MTITPINLGNTAIPAATALAGGSAGEAAAVAGIPGFADLLSFQLKDVAAQIRAEFAPTDKAATTEAPIEGATVTDPAQLLAGMLGVTPPTTAKPEAATTRAEPSLDVALDTGKRSAGRSETPLPNVRPEAEPSAEAALPLSKAVPETGAAALATAKDDGTAKFAGAAAIEAPSGNFTQTLAAHDSRAPTTRMDANPAPVNTPLNDSRWSQDFGDKIVWMARHDRQSAQININPPQLGPVQITLDIRGDQATALFVSAHGEVRQAIESAMPQLREMLSGAGINLGQANVGAQFARQDGGGQQPSDSSRFSDDNAILHGDSSQGASAPVAIQRGRGMVDLFA